METNRKQRLIMTAEVRILLLKISILKIGLLKDRTQKAKNRESKPINTKVIVLAFSRPSPRYRVAANKVRAKVPENKKVEVNQYFRGLFSTGSFFGRGFWLIT